MPENNDSLCVTKLVYGNQIHTQDAIVEAVTKIYLDKMQQKLRANPNMEIPYKLIGQELIDEIKQEIDAENVLREKDDKLQYPKHMTPSLITSCMLALNYIKNIVARM